MRRAWMMVLMVELASGLALPQASPSGQKTLAATVNVYVFPTKGQTAGQQSQDKAALDRYRSHRRAGGGALGRGMRGRGRWGGR